MVLEDWQINCTEENMSKIKIEKELIKVRGQLQSLQKKEAYLEQELKMAEAA